MLKLVQEKALMLDSFEDQLQELQTSNYSLEAEILKPHEVVCPVMLTCSIEKCLLYILVKDQNAKLVYIIPGQQNSVLSNGRLKTCYSKKRHQIKAPDT